MHTETIGKLPKVYEAVMNTPSHHRVHHGSNPQYIDKNYAGIFIIWDKMFGSFAEEQEKVVYGVSPAINSVNPLVVFFHGFTGLAAKMWQTKGLGNKLAYLIQPPGWQPSGLSPSRLQSSEQVPGSTNEDVTKNEDVAKNKAEVRKHLK